MNKQTTLGKLKKINEQYEAFRTKRLAAINKALAAGATNQEIGLILGISRQAVWSLKKNKEG